MAEAGERLAARRSLSTNVSVYLDLIRIVATMVVFVGHAGKFMFGRYESSIFRFLLMQGGSVIAVFFVLSGFVISFVAEEKEADWRDFLIARAARVYSVPFLALAVVVLADYAGNHFNPQYYITENHILNFYQPVSLHAALRLLSFTNELWFSHTIFGTDEPYWTMGFEVPYYIFFGLLLFTTGKVRNILFVTWFLVVGPKVALYLPLWLMGVATFRILRSGRADISPRMAGFTLAFTVVAYIVLWRALANLDLPMYQIGTPLQIVLSVCFYTLTAILLCINILAFHALLRDRPFWPRPAKRWIRWVSGACFTLYVVHQPLIVATSAIFPITTKHGLYGVTACLVILLLVLVLAELGERRKNFFTVPIRRIVYTLFPQPRPSRLAWPAAGQVESSAVSPDQRAVE